jgi:acetyl-CoA acyltransferase
MGIGPIVAIPKALKLAGLSIEDIDLWELNEAFASQSIQVIRHLGIDINKVNVARALLERGDPAAARIALEGYLHRWPLGEHAAATRAMLAELPE